MSGKLIMKRKLDKTEQSSFNKAEIQDETSAPTSSSVSTSNNQKSLSTESNESLVKQPENKRIRCDTPPPESNRENRHLLEAIQLKMLELQNELDAFEHDIEAHEEEYYYINENNHSLISEQGTEALGFAMCAQETMLFLQREGIPSDSPLYTRLREALIDRSPSDRIFHL